MTGLRLLPALAAATFLSLAPAAAWAPETRASFVDEAVRLMPASLSKALEHHRRPLLRGMLSPMTGEDGAQHRPPWAEGTLDAQIEAEVAALAAAVERAAPFEEIAERFGALAHYVADAGFPPGVTDGDGATHYEHFKAFCHARSERFPVVFYGHEDAQLAARDYRGYAASVMRRAMLDDRTLSRTYAEAGDPPHPSAFDDRSVPFAVASLSYSHTFTDIVRVWIAAWDQVGGDMARTPYRKRH